MLNRVIEEIKLVRPVEEKHWTSSPRKVINYLLEHSYESGDLIVIPKKLLIDIEECLDD